MSLSVDLWKLQECLEDSLARLYCLKDCYLQDHPMTPLPDFVFPLQKILQETLLEIHHLQQIRPQVLQAIQDLQKDPEHQKLMARLAEAELQDPGVAEARAEKARKELARLEEQVEVLGPWKD